MNCPKCKFKKMIGGTVSIQNKDGVIEKYYTYQCPKCGNMVTNMYDKIVEDEDK